MKLTRTVHITATGLLAGLIFAHSASSAMQVVSKADPAIPDDNGTALGSIISEDGSSVLFHTISDNQRVNICVQATTDGTPVLVSANTNGLPANGDSTATDFSPDGRWVAFESEASDLVAGDTNNATDVFLHDTFNQQTFLISASNNGLVGDKKSHSPATTPDGRYVAFVSDATNLTLHDTNGIADIFLRDRLSNTTVLVSVGAIRWGTNYSESMTPAISTNGQIIAYASTANGLVPGVSLSNAYSQIYVHDLESGTNRLASTNSIAGLGIALQWLAPLLSADGRYVVFNTAMTSGGILIYRADLQTGAMKKIGFNTSLPSYPQLYPPAMTPDGRCVAYVGPTSASGHQVYCWDGLTETNELISANTNGLEAAGNSDTLSISADGRYVTFLSMAPDLVTNPISSYQVFLRDRLLQTNILISIDPDGKGSGDLSAAIPSLSADGRTVAFDSVSDSFVGGASTSSYDVFVRNVAAGTTTKLTQSEGIPSASGQGWSQTAWKSISADGRYIAFSSTAENLAPQDTNRFADVFLQDMQAGTTTLISRGTNGAQSNGRSLPPAISGNGRTVAYLSYASNLTAQTVYPYDNLFVYDTVSRLTQLANVTANGLSGGQAPVIEFSLSSDGTRAVFATRANLHTTGSSGSHANIYVRDLNTGTNLMIPRSPSQLVAVNMGNPVISPDGRFVVFNITSVSDNSKSLFLYDTNVTVLLNGLYAGPATFSGDGRWLATLYKPTSTTFGVFLRNLVAGTNTTIELGANITATYCSGLVMGYDGRHFAFVSNERLNPLDTKSYGDVFLYEIGTRELTLVSMNLLGTGPGNGHSTSPSISDDGRYVTFRSRASDLVVNDANHMSDVFLYDRITGQITLVSQPLAGAGSANHFSSYPFISADGSRISFTSFANDLVDNDLNLATDVFVYDVPTAVPADSDHDGMEDAWERDQFGDLSHDGLADGDGDGATDVEEFLAGTVPTNPASRFECLASAQAPGEMQLSWPAAPGRSYQVQFRSSLDETQWQVLPGQVTVVGNQGVLTDTNAMGQRFYRAVLIP